MTNRAERHAEAFAETMLAAIRKGTAPWQKPWRPGESPFPRNFKTKRPYNGSNLMLLMATGINRGYGDPRWGGFGQIRTAGGCVRKGEKGTPVLIVRNRKAKTTEGRGRRGRSDESDESGVYITMKHVFNVSQADGLELEPLETRTEPEWDAIEDVEQVTADAHVTVQEGPTFTACYQPLNDVVQMPSRGQFDDSQGFYQSLLHELSHATAHPSRMDRPAFTTAPNHGSVEYALEELRAEMSAMMTGVRLGLGHSPRNGEAYVAHWVRSAGEDPNAIRNAARDAQAMGDWLLRNRKATEAPEELEQAA